MGWTAVSRFARTHPFATDAALAATVYVLAMVTVMRAERYADVTVPSAIAGFVVCAAVALRRRWPMAVLAVSTAGAIATIVVTNARSPYPVVAALAAYTVATRFDRKFAWTASIASAAVLVLAGIIVSGDYLGNSVIIQPIAWIGMATAAGDAVRIRRAYVAEVEERARRAEQTRDEVAARMVAEERLRIARELHDLVAHRIAVINVHAGVAGHLVRTQPEDAAEAIEHVRAASRSVLGELSTLLGVLRSSEDSPAPTEPTPGLAQLDELVQSFTAAGLTIDLAVAGEADPLPDTVDLAAYRIIQESLTNVRRHSRGLHATIRLTHRQNAVLVDVHSPDGERSPADAPGSSPAGHGIVGMRERAASVGGTLQAGTCPDGGFLVSAVLPRGSEG
ncbi:MAG TPA: histidine kinase [Pseudonocardia sp.]|uniref:sensor histidine kinase n=1 Tax=Pseudonocardia sp. TaxID=60912 RepID=UPI002C350B7E|nr:histidine kinase [Pseudonocardia sp.]HTF46463.1 histidine kinase [Pseudonocardia sp.]